LEKVALKVAFFLFKNFLIFRENLRTMAARDSDTIFNFLIDQKNADPILSAILTSSSKASFYQSLFALYAQTTADFELTFEDFEETVEELLESKQVMTTVWWQRISLAFQYGDPLVILPNGNLGYDPIVEANQIVKRAAVVSSKIGAINLKVAKLDVDDITPIPLTAPEKSAFDSYINDVQPAGIAVTVTSVDGDEVEVGLDVIIDPQVINVDDGTLLSDGVTKPVEDAVFAYFSQFQLQDGGFGGIFYTSKLNEQVLAASGVISSVITKLNKKASNESVFTDVLAITSKSFQTYSGYVRLAVGYDLSANINYTKEPE
jgi:hypothetical protein